MDAPALPQLHALRIDGKYLRYTLEFFQEVLPPDAEALIHDVVDLQDELGALHDADVAAGLIHAYLGESHHPDAPPPPPGLAAYQAERAHARQTLHAEFAGTWAGISGAPWRARLAAAVAAV
jgi:CHAD domain-containing protein